MTLFSKKTFNSVCLLSLVAGMSLFGSCKGPEGDPGPAGKDGINGTNGTNGKDGVNGTNGTSGTDGAQGIPGIDGQKAFEDGFIKGTMKGIRRDGTPFEEPFEFTLTDRIPMPEEGNLTIQIRKFLDTKSYNFNNLNLSNGAEFGFYNNGNLSQQPTLSGFRFDFKKPIENNKLFSVTANVNFNEPASERVLAIADEHNGQYQFLHNGRLRSEDYDRETEQSLLVFSTATGHKVYYTQPSIESWGEFMYVVDKNGVKSTTSALYSGVKLGFELLDNNLDYWQNLAFYATSGNTNLSKTIIVEANTSQISNYQYKEQAQLSFDYKIVVNGFDNTTMNPLEITGSVQTTAYNGMVLRKSFE